MKTTKLFAALGMAAALFTGCSSEESTTDQGTTPNGITVGVEYDTDSVTRVTPATESVAVYDEEKGGVPVNLFDPQWSAQGADTRMTHDDYGTGDFLWEGTDKLGLLYIPGSVTRVVDYLDLKSGAGSNEAKFFRILNFTATGNYFFLPFYPYETKYGNTVSEGSNSNSTKQYIDADQGDGKGWKNYAFATGNTIQKPIAADTKNVSISGGTLQHKNTYVKFTVRSGNGTYTGKSVKSIKIEAPSTIAGTCWAGPTGVTSWVSGTESTSVTLSNADAFQGTIQTTCTNLVNYQYNTAYSAQGSMMVIKAGSFTPVITVTLTDNTELQRTMTNAINFKAGYLRIVNLNLDDFTNTATTYKVTVAASTGGTVNITAGTGATASGNSVSTTSSTATFTATATPNTGYLFEGWYDGTTKVSTNASFTAAVKDYDGKTLTAAFGRLYTVDDYYMWDAYSHFVTGDDYDHFGPGNEAPNRANSATTVVTASQSCANCPTRQQALNYIATDSYWEDGSSTNSPHFYVKDGAGTILGPISKGLWLKKGGYNTMYSGPSNTEFTPPLATDDIRTNGQYFFLPLTGYRYDGSGFGSGISEYWTCESAIDSVNPTQFAYALYIWSHGDNYTVEVSVVNRGQGARLWTLQ